SAREHVERRIFAGKICRERARQGIAARSERADQSEWSQSTGIIDPGCSAQQKWHFTSRATRRYFQKRTTCELHLRRQSGQNAERVTRSTQALRRKTSALYRRRKGLDR